jgi:hypothetical protein
MAEAFLKQMQEALESIREERFFGTERGFQGELLAELRKRLRESAFPADPVVEQEYQKTLPLHGIKIRPDLIIHIPFERERTGTRQEGNFVAVELKLRASAEEAMDAFNNLLPMKEILHYPVTIFINIDSEKTYSDVCLKTLAGQTICCAVRLEEGKMVVPCDKT